MIRRNLSASSTSGTNEHGDATPRIDGPYTPVSLDEIQRSNTTSGPRSPDPNLRRLSADDSGSKRLSGNFAGSASTEMSGAISPSRSEVFLL